MLGRRQAAGLAVAVGGDDIGAHHRVGPVELLRRLEAAAIDLQRLEELGRREVRGEGVGQSELGGEHGAEVARSENPQRSAEHTSELQSLMRISYAVFCLKKQQTHARK